MGTSGGSSWPEGGGVEPCSQRPHPPYSYVTQLYYKISRIDWDYEAEPARIKGSECPPLPPQLYPQILFTSPPPPRVAFSFHCHHWSRFIAPPLPPRAILCLRY